MLKKQINSIFLLTTLIGAFCLTIVIHKVDASSTIHIRINGLVEGTDKITSADNTTYTLIDNINGSIVVERSNIIIDGNGYTLNGSSLNVTLGFNLTSVNNVTIRNINIDSFAAAGILLFTSSANIIYGNNITNNYNGIWLDSSVNNTISENSISANNWFGVYLGNFSHYNNVSGNELKTNYLHAINIDLSSNNSIIRNNIRGNKRRGVNLIFSSNNTISDNNVEANNWNGIRLTSSSDNIITRNNVTDNMDGIFLIESSDHNTITQNTVTDTGEGIATWLCSNNYITGNHIVNNLIGVYLRLSSDNIIGNLITNNNVGIYLGNSSNNLVYHNNLINNTNQAYATSDFINTWDNSYPSGGNYWSDYNGTDQYNGSGQNISGSDFIGDTPYIINSSNSDRYPLMIPHETEPPTIAILHPENRTYAFTSGIPLNFTVDEPVSWIGYSLDGEANTTITGNTTLPVVLDGVHYVVVYARDAVGNVGVSNQVYFTVDATSPIITVLHPENRTYAFTSGIPLNFTVDEPVSWIGYSLDGEANTTITGNTTLPVVLDGVHYVVVYARDAVGNVGVSNQVYFTVDATSPIITVLHPENRTYAFTSGIPLNFTVDEPVSWIGYSLDGQANTTISGNTTLPVVVDGVHYVVVYARDAVGNVGVSDQVYFTVDVTSPIVTILYPENRTYAFTSGIPLNFTVDEPVSWIGYSLDKQANVTITENVTLPALFEGYHDIIVFANDTFGNMGASERVFFTVELLHDIAIINLTTSKTGCTPMETVGKGSTINMTIIVENQGNSIETFNVTVKVNTTVLVVQSVTLNIGENRTLTFTWNTTNFVRGNYTISATADVVSGETDVADNTMTYGTVLVTIPGDVDGDRDVDIFDIVRMAVVFGAVNPDISYNPNCDIDNDGDNDIFDIVAAAGHYDESW